MREKFRREPVGKYIDPSRVEYIINTIKYCYRNDIIDCQLFNCLLSFLDRYRIVNAYVINIMCDNAVLSLTNDSKSVFFPFNYSGTPQGGDFWGQKLDFWLKR